jgi:hypothetical protein
MASHFTKPKPKTNLSKDEKLFAAEILSRVYESMRFDPDMSAHGQLHQCATFTDGGRFILSLNRLEFERLFTIIEKLENERT